MDERRKINWPVVVAGVQVDDPDGGDPLECGFRWVERAIMTPDNCDVPTEAAIELYMGMRRLAPSRRTIKF